MSIESIITYGGIGAAFGVIRGIFQGGVTGWKQWTMVTFVSVNVAVATGYGATGFGMDRGLVYAAVAIATLGSESICRGIMRFFELAEKDPLGAIKTIRGK